MKLVGVQYRTLPLGKGARPSPSIINRVVLIDGHLREAGMRVFLYGPQHIKPAEATVEGCLFEKGKFLPHTAPVPAVNGNWTSRTRRLLAEGMGYLEFGKWAQERSIGIYVPHAFSELLGDKHETYKLVRTFHESLHPHSELYTRSQRQLAHFVDTGRITFLKPRTGSKGEGIVTLRRGENGLSVSYYEGGKLKRHPAKTIRDAFNLIRELTRPGKSYVVQHGVETMRHGRSTFDIRVVMLHDGNAWNWITEARLSPEGSDVSNVSQGGASVPTKDLLVDLLGPEGGQQLLYELKSESFGLAASLERIHPGDIMEVAFDFVVNREGKLRVVELNTKPGIAGIGSEVSILDKKPEDEPQFERIVYPHVRHLARFLMTKAQRLGA